MRIIAGMRRGLKLNPPDGLEIRPTTDRVKESVFNILQPYLPACSVLDLFAGSGALGLEALSRGSERCVFVDRSPAALALVRENLRTARFEAAAQVLAEDSLHYLAHCDRKFDLIFLDPPYNKGLMEPVLRAISVHGLLAPGGVLAAETERGGETVPDTYYAIKKTAVYGKTVITVFEG